MRRTVVLVAGLWLIAGCFTPTFDDVQCGPLGECPPGHTCNLATGLCEKGVVEPMFDASVTPDAPSSDVDGAPDPDAATVDAAPLFVCDLLTQDGCDGGEECTVIGSGFTINPFDLTNPTVSCQIGEGGADLGQPCGWDTTEMISRDSCAEGLLCSDNDGLCRAYCDLNDEQDPCVTAGGTCAKPSGGVLDDVPGVGLCTPSS